MYNKQLRFMKVRGLINDEKHFEELMKMMDNMTVM